MRSKSAKTQSSGAPSKLWWLLGVILLLLFLVVQLPASWLVARFAPKQQVLENINGNLWRGQAQWRLPEALRGRQMATPVSGGVDWKLKPWTLFMLRAGADVTLTTGETNLKGEVLLSKSAWQVREVTGTLAANTLKAFAPIQMPNAPIMLEGLSLGRSDGGWTKADGLMTWAGGKLGYHANGKLERANLPALKAHVSLEKSRKTNNSGDGANEKLHLELLSANDERMGDIYLDGDNMLDVQLTQRMLVNVQGYQGNAAMDTAVVSVRQPLSSLSR